MQAKSSVSDYRENSQLSWVPGQTPAEPARKEPRLVVVGKARQAKLKPGLY